MRNIVASLAVAATLVVSGCTSTGDTSSSSVLRIAIEQDAKTLNPILASSTVDVFVQRLLFEPLLSADERGTPVPILASQVPSVHNGGISRDGLTITYRLRKTAKWSDGVPVTSDDVKFSWSAIENPQNNAVSRHGYEVVSRIDTPDPYSVVVHLREPFAPFVNTFFAESDQPYTIVPAHVLRHYSSINRIPFNDHPTVTDGPFRLEQWTHGDHLSFIRNEKFFLGTPSLERIEVRVVPDENTGVNLLRTHEIDFMYEASVSTYPSLRSAPGVRITWVNANGYVALGLNTSHPPLGDARVRRALALAIDKTALVRTTTYGQESVATGDLPGWMWAENPNLRVTPSDTGAARSLLQSAGVTNLSLVLVTDVANVTNRHAALQIQAMLHKAGVDTEVKYYPADLLYAQAAFGGIVHGGKFDLVVIPWYGGIDPDNSSEFSCRNIPPNGYNIWRYCNREMDALQQQALSTYDSGRRRAAYWKIEALVTRDNPLIPLWWQRQQEAISDRLKGFAPNPICESWNAWQWRW